MKKVCGKSMPKGRNNADRGFCSKPSGHSAWHGNNTCPTCGVVKDKNNTPSVKFRKTNGLSCNTCVNTLSKENSPYQRMNSQNPESRHVFPCGCSDRLPKQGESNAFVRWVTKSWGCRVTSILLSGIKRARQFKFKPISLDTPHTIIRDLMKNKICIMCKVKLSWDKRSLGPGKTPHLHHDHDTGKILGFTHPVCNPRALKDEIHRLQNKIKNLEKRLKK
jgi:Recombination endonuclease VII